MDYQIAKPSEVLAPYIKQYWRLESCLAKGKTHIQRIVPSGLFELIIYLQDKPKSTDPKKNIDDNLTLIGQLSGHHDLLITKRLSLFAIYFLPQGLSMHLNLPWKELRSQTIPLNYILKDTKYQLEDELPAAETFQEQISAAEHFLLAQLQKNEE